jgi:hypothetical protein
MNLAHLEMSHGNYKQGMNSTDMSPTHALAVDAHAQGTARLNMSHAEHRQGMNVIDLSPTDGLY